MKELMNLFFVFFKMGAITFGGGYSMLPIIQREIVETRGWADEEEIIDYFAIGQSTPGIIAINVATFIGYKRRGIKGAVFATLGMICPSIIVISLIANFLEVFSNNALINQALNGIKIVVIALVFTAIIKIFKKSVKNLENFLVFIISFLIVAILGKSPVFLILIALSYGVIKFFFLEVKKK